MRKFKAFDKSNSNLGMSAPFGLDEAPLFYPRSGCAVEMHDWLECTEIVQWTGLKDKNGVEIYEGDIVRVMQGDIAVCVWEPVHTGFSLRPPGTSRCFSVGHTSSGECTQEVIGNIHKNPELLK